MKFAHWTPVLLLATLVAYAPVLSASFLNLDDYRYLTAVRPFTVERIVHFFTHFFEGYHPLTLVTLGLTFRLAEFNPWLHHAVNLALHLLNTALVYRLATRLLNHRPAALLAAAAFGLHPIHVEAVAWVTSRKDVLYACFYLLGLNAYLAHKRLRTVACFLLAALSKGMAVSFPLALIALDVATQRPLTARTLILQKLPYWLGALAFGLVSIRAQQASGYVPDLADTGDLLARADLALAALWRYATHLVCLDAITAFHPYPSAATLRASALAGAALLALGATACTCTWRRQPRIAGAILLFLAGIVLVLQLVPVADFIVADRYNYISSVGFSLGLGMLFARGLATPRLRRAALAGAAAYLLTLGVATHAYARAWRDSESLWTHVLARHPDAVFPLNMRGCARSDLGQYAAAVADFDRAAAVNPVYTRTYLNRGFARDKLGDPDGALADYETLLALEPGNPAAHNNRGLILLRRGQAPEAEAEFSRAIELGATRPAAHLFFGNRAEARLAQGNATGARDDATEALARFPRAFNAWLVRAQAHHQLGDAAAALEDLAQAEAIDPADPRIAKLRASLP